MWDIFTFRLARDYRYPWRRRLAYGAVFLAALLVIATASAPHPLCFDALFPLVAIPGVFYLLIAVEVDSHLRARESRRLMNRIRDRHLKEKEERVDAYALAVSNQRERVADYERASYRRIGDALQALQQEDTNRRLQVRDLYLEEHEKLRAYTLAALKQIEDERNRDGEGWKRP